MTRRDHFISSKWFFNVYLPFSRLVVQFGLYIFLCSNWRLVVLQVFIQETNVALKSLKIYMETLRNLYEDRGLRRLCNLVLLLPSEPLHTFYSFVFMPFLLLCFLTFITIKLRLTETVLFLKSLWTIWSWSIAIRMSVSALTVWIDIIRFSRISATLLQ